MNKALLRHVDWEYPAGRFGLITVSSSVMRKLFELLTIDQARTFGKEAGTQFFSEFVNFWFKALDFKALLKALEFLGDRYAREFHFDQSFDGKAHTIIFKRLHIPMSGRERQRYRSSDLSPIARETSGEGRRGSS